MLKAEFVQLGFANEDSERGRSATAAVMLVTDEASAGQAPRQIKILLDAQLNTAKTVTFCLYVQTFINKQSCFLYCLRKRKQKHNTEITQNWLTMSDKLI